jgi:hypothetical protein
LKKGDLSKFVDLAVRRAVFDETAREVKEHNEGADPDELQHDIDAALREFRAGRT